MTSTLKNKLKNLPASRKSKVTKRAKELVAQVLTQVELCTKLHMKHKRK